MRGRRDATRRDGARGPRKDNQTGIISPIREFALSSFSSSRAQTRARARRTRTHKRACDGRYLIKVVCATKFGNFGDNLPSGKQREGDHLIVPALNASFELCSSSCHRNSLSARPCVIAKFIIMMPAESPIIHKLSTLFAHPRIAGIVRNKYDTIFGIYILFIDLFTFLLPLYLSPSSRLLPSSFVSRLFTETLKRIFSP